VQLRFSKTLFLQALALIGIIAAWQAWLNRLGDRQELGERSASLHFSPARLATKDFAPLRLAGSWTLTSDDPRFGGISALALDSGEFVALTDSGAVVRFAKPGTGRTDARIAELPGGPGPDSHKVNRDSEALLRDPLGRGWWVGFETRNQAWLYDPAFTRPLARIAFGAKRWPKNLGIEGLAADGSAVLLFPEAGKAAVRWDGKRAHSESIRHSPGRIADAARLPGGGLMVVHRDVTLSGVVNRLTLLQPEPGGGWRTARSLPLPVSRVDNVEALAAERLPDGRTRLWLMTDDNFQRPLRTLLIAVDVPMDLGG